ncbi:MAG TPA: HAMP domain-containing sensor histidine kinase [Kofleriaceae bacterium]|jgi:signal transduction histidine kinase|nr:HAMP domain-containing sensor histidine kinase [Kofleriaceae bacterium]
MMPPSTNRASTSGPAVGPPRQRRRFRSLASRLVALGVVQLALLTVTAAVIFIAEGPHEEAAPEDQLTPAALRHLESLVDAPAPLSDALDELRAARVEVSLYDEAHQLIASNVDPPLAIPPRPHRGHRGLWGPPGPASDGAADHSPDHRLDHPLDHGLDHPPDHGLDHPDHGLDHPPDHGLDHPDHGLDHLPDHGPAGPPGPPGSGPDRPDAAFGSALDFRPPFDYRPMLTRRMIARHYLVLPFPVHGARGVLIARGDPGGPPGLTGPLLALICGFLILVIGALITARWIVRPIERLSRTARALGSGDLQARSQLDRPDEIGELGHRFDEMADRIAGLLATEKELLANVAHELRTPLTRIGVALDLASEGDAEAARASLAEIAVDVSELETIVDDILTAMRFELASARAPAQLPLRRARIPAGEIATAAADRLRARHPERALELDVPHDLPAINVDPVLLRRVIDNLLENAHKYTPDAGSPIRLAARRDAGELILEVADRGIGIPTDDLPRIFTAFFRGERSRSRETGGVGLGLTLARRIVEAHGGTIDVTSTPNAGTTVQVAIPVD